MRISKTATIQSEFRCPLYPDLGKITFKLCLNRQLARIPGTGYLYRECTRCKDGKKIQEHFKNYEYVYICNPGKKKSPNWNTTGVAANVQKKKTQVSAGEPAEKKKMDNIGMIAGKISEPECNNCKTLLRGQIEYAIDLIRTNYEKEGIKRLNLILEEIEKI